MEQEITTTHPLKGDGYVYQICVNGQIYDLHDNYAVESLSVEVDDKDKNTLNIIKYDASTGTQEIIKGINLADEIAAGLGDKLEFIGITDENMQPSSEFKDGKYVITYQVPKEAASLKEANFVTGQSDSTLLGVYSSLNINNLLYEQLKDSNNNTIGLPVTCISDGKAKTADSIYLWV